MLASSSQRRWPLAQTFEARRARVERTLPFAEPAGEDEDHHQRVRRVRRGRRSAPGVPALPQCCEGCPLVHKLQGGVCRGCGLECFCVICAPCSAVHGAPGGDGDSTRWKQRSRLVLRCGSCCRASLSGARALLTRCETPETEDVVATDDNMQETEENWVNNERSCVP